MPDVPSFWQRFVRWWYRVLVGEGPRLSLREHDLICDGSLVKL